MYDTLMFVNDLEALGIPRVRAEGYVKVVKKMVDSNFATKQDLIEQTTEIRHEMKVLSIELRGEMKEIGSELRHEMREMESRLTLKLGSIVVVTMTAAVALMKLVG